MQRLPDVMKEEEGRVNALIQKELTRFAASVRLPAEYIVSSGGKRIRPLLVVLSARSCGFDHPDVYALGVAIEYLHAASLLHDDIMDGAVLRRGRPSAHKLFGLTRTVLAGDVMCAVSSKIVAEMNDPRLSGLLADALAYTASGQAAELEKLYALDVTEEEYLKIITGKTARLISIACAMGAVRGGAAEETVEALTTFGLELGRAFQLIDDALDIAQEQETGKPTGGDLREGKFTPPLRFYLETLTQTEKEAFAELFRPGRLGDEEAAALAARMRERHCDEKTRSLAEGYLQKAGAALARLPENPARTMLGLLPQYIRERKK